MDIAKIIEMGPGAVLALVLIGVLFFVGRSLPPLLNTLVLRLDQTIQRLEEAIDCNSAILLGLQQQLLAHDLTVSGLNPSTGATVDERTNRAYFKYLEVQKQLEGAREMILARHRAGNATPPLRTS